MSEVFFLIGLILFIHLIVAVEVIGLLYGRDVDPVATAYVAIVYAMIYMVVVEFLDLITLGHVKPMLKSRNWYPKETRQTKLTEVSEQE